MSSRAPCTGALRGSRAAPPAQHVGKEGVHTARPPALCACAGWSSTQHRGSAPALHAERQEIALILDQCQHFRSPLLLSTEPPSVQVVPTPPSLWGEGHRSPNDSQDLGDMASSCSRGWWGSGAVVQARLRPPAEGTAALETQLLSLGPDLQGVRSQRRPLPACPQRLAMELGAAQAWAPRAAEGRPGRCGTGRLSESV